MNIFVCNEDPVLAAWSLDDKRVIKMILESAQMLSTAVWINLSQKRQIPGLYQPAYLSHPCTKWASLTSGNFNWLYAHADALCNVYELTYERMHSSRQIIEACKLSSYLIPRGKLTEFCNCTPYKSLKDTRGIVEKYQIYLNDKWKNDIRTPTWRKRIAPHFKTQKVIN